MVKINRAGKRLNRFTLVHVFYLSIPKLLPDHEALHSFFKYINEDE